MINKKMRFYIFAITALLLPLSLLAQSSSAPKNLPFADTDRVTATAEVLSVFQTYQNVGQVDINVPTVVEVPFDGIFIERTEFGVVEMDNNTFIPYLFTREHEDIPFSITSNLTSGSDTSLYDNKSNTFAEYALPFEGQGIANINLTSGEPISSSVLYLNLDTHVALPSLVEIRAIVDGQEKIVFAKSKMNSKKVNFPKTTSSDWKIYLTYAQPLRISELRFSQEERNSRGKQSLRFLAQPNKIYRIYFNPDQSIRIVAGESGNLFDDKGVLNLAPVPSQRNETYIPADVDEDGVRDELDNCINVKNSNQLDIDRNGRGDACDDFDRDGRINSVDNCPDDPNVNQEDEDGDGIGDVCDTEESRLTERYTWVPWVGMGIAALVLLVLFGTALKSMQRAKVEDEELIVEESDGNQVNDMSTSDNQNVSDDQQQNDGLQ